MDSQSDDSLAGGRRLRLRFSLLALLIFMTAACLLLAWVAQPRRYVAETRFQVNLVRPTVFGPSEPFDEREYEKFCQAQIAYVKSAKVIQAALRKPTIAQLPMIARQADVVSWLCDNIEASFPQNSQIFSIRLHGTEAQSTQLAQIVDAVAEAYQKEVVFVDDLRLLAAYDAKAKSVKKLRERIEIKTKALAGHEGDGDAAAESSKAEIEALTELWRDLFRSMEIDDVNANSEPRVFLVQPATAHRE